MKTPNFPGLDRSGQPCRCPCHAEPGSGPFGQIRHIQTCCSPAPQPPQAGIKPDGQPCRCICHALAGIDHVTACCEVLP